MTNRKIRPEENRKYPSHSVKRIAPSVTPKKVKPTKLPSGMIVADGVKVGRVHEGKIAFYDKDKRRSETRGTNEVLIDIKELKELCDDCPNKNDPEENTEQKEFDTDNKIEYT